MVKKSNGLVNLLINVLFVFIIVIAGVITVVSLNTRKEDGVANIMGYAPFSIQSKSMEDTILKGDLIISTVYDGQELKIGDVITFNTFTPNAQGQEVKIINTHRIVAFDAVTEAYTTKGDNNEANDERSVLPGDILAVYEGTRIPMAGSAMDFFRSKYGFLIGIILPIFVFFIYQLYIFIGLVVELKKSQEHKSK